MTARKKTARKKKSGARKSLGKRSAKKKAAASSMAVVDADGRPSPYARDVQKLFASGVQQALARMARRNIEAVVYVDGELVKAVPHRQGGRFVVRETPGRRGR